MPERPAPPADAPAAARTLATVAAAAGLLLILAGFLPWARFTVRPAGDRADIGQAVMTSSGVDGPVALGGRFVTGLGALAALTAGVFVLRPGLSPRWRQRMLLYAGGALLLALWFAVGALRLATCEGKIRLGSDLVPAVATKEAIHAGLVLATALAAVGTLAAFAAAFVSWRGTGPVESAA